MLFNAAYDPRRLILCIKAAIDRNGEAARLIGPELLRLTPTIVGDHAVRRIKNGLRGAIVLLKGDHLRLRPVTLKVEDVADVCAAPRIDGLIVIPHDAEISVSRCQLANPCILNTVRILVLINVQVLPLRAVSLGDCGRLLQQPQSLNQQIVKVERLESLQLLRVSARKPGDQPLMVRDGQVVHLIGTEPIVLRPTNCAEDQARLR